jgi:hypothetical protein
MGHTELTVRLLFRRRDVTNVKGRQSLRTNAFGLVRRCPALALMAARSGPETSKGGHHGEEVEEGQEEGQEEQEEVTLVALLSADQP